MIRNLIPTWQSTILFYRDAGAICEDKIAMRKQTRCFSISCPPGYWCAAGT